MASNTNSKRVKITQRLGKCTCGCKGSDSQHAQKIVRTVRNVAAFDLCLPPSDAIRLVRVVLACGTYSHPEGERVCYLVQWYFDGKVNGRGVWYAERAWYGNK